MSWYLSKVVKLPQSDVGLCLLGGQIADGITTPLVGVYSDKFNSRFGKRMIWYFWGFLFVSPTFAGLYLYPEFVNKLEEDGITPKNERLRFWWYFICPFICNIAWACVQISHMSIVNSLTFSNRQRDKLVNNRNGFTYIANIIVLSLALLFFLTLKDAIDQFRYMCLIGLVLGLVTSLFYMCSINEV